MPLSVCGEAASRPLEAITLVGLGITTLSMPASGILPVKAALAAVDLPASAHCWRRCAAPARPRRSLREPIAAWAREHDVPV